MREKIVIVGSGGFGREVLCLIDKTLYDPIGFIDPSPDSNASLYGPVLGDDTIIQDLRKNNIASSIIIAIGNMRRRKELFELALLSGLTLPTIIHPSAVVLTEYPITPGTIIYPNVVVMNGCRIGKGVLLNSGVTLGHDVAIGDFSNINPGAHLAGKVKVGERVLIGIGASILENLTIGDEAVVGAGSVVLRDVSAKSTAYGVPAKVHEQGMKK
jgi:sugar O-acyltransferase (sialic acid O-acetyltransferase NeuD family)